MALPSEISRFRLFITHVDGEDHFLKISGQIDQQSPLMLESLIMAASERFENGVGSATPKSIHEGMLCAAKYKDGTYYRAKVINTSNISTGLVGVQFIDFGNRDIISISTIRLLDNFDPMLLQLRGQATDFYLSRVIQSSGMWDDSILQKLRTLICYSEYSATTDANTSTPLISINFEGQDLSQYLAGIRFGIAIPIAQQELLLISESKKSPKWQPNTLNESQTFQEHVPFLLNQKFPSNPASAMRLQLNTSLPFNAAIPPPSLISQRLQINKVSRTTNNLKPPSRQPQVAMHQATLPNTDKILAQAPILGPKTVATRKITSPKKSSTYKSKPLEVNSEHKVFVSYGEEGPELFAIQIVADCNKLQEMMDEINKRPLSSLTEPPIIGTVCLGRMKGDRIICRAIVTSLSGSQCKLFFVDFGDTEMVSYYDIFDIPDEFVKPNVYAIRFCLSGVKKLEKGPYLNETFKQLTRSAIMTLKVVSPEGPPLIQYGELYLEDKNVLELLMANMKDKLQFKWLEMLPVGTRQSVLVSYVDSCIKFYIQLSDNIDDLNAVMAAVRVHCENSKSPGVLPVGAACCARFPEDKNWYRARVRDTKGDKIVVAYVDYGNEHEVTKEDLRSITADLVKLPAQALKCALKGFENRPVESKTSNQLEMLALEKTLISNVVGVLSSDTMLVTLVNDTISPPLDVAKKMNQLMQPRAHEAKATTPIRKDAPESFSSPEGSQPDERRKSLKREASFREERRPPREDSQDFGQRGGSFRSRDNKESFDRSGPGRHSEKFAGRPERGDRNERRGQKPWENQTSPPQNAPAADEWAEPAAPAQSFQPRREFNSNRERDGNRDNFRDNRDRRKPRSEGQDKAGQRSTWRKDVGGAGKRLRQAAEEASADTNTVRASIQDRLKRDRFNQPGEREERKNEEWGNRNRENRPERQDNRGERREWGEKKEGWQKRDFRDNRSERPERGDRPARTNFTPRDRAEKNERTFGSEKSYNSQNSNERVGRSPPFKPRGKFTQVESKELPEPVSLETPFEEPTVELGAQHEVSVTWIISPESFFTQILALQQKFLDMMHKIPDLYKGVKPFTGAVPIGASVLARYPADGVLYRANVVSAQPFSKFIVRYVDFGNKQLVDARDIWQLDRSLMELPKMAVHCLLVGVAPKDGEWKADTEIDLCFNAPRYQCVFQECAEGVYQVSLWNNGVNVADTLVEKQLALASEHQTSVTLKDEPIDMTIIVGQQIMCRVTHVESYDNFYIQLDLLKAALVEETIANYDVARLTPPSADTVVDGTHVTVKHEGKINRAILQDVSDKAHITAVLPDYGKTITTSVENLMVLPTDLSVYYYQSLHCSLHNYTDTCNKLISVEELKTRLTGNKFIVYVNYVDGITLVTTLYDATSGKKVSIFEPDEGAYDEVVPLCMRPVYNYNFGMAYISHAENLNEIYLQKSTDGDRLAELLDELYKFYEEGTPEALINYEIEGSCVAKSSDSNWYRASILSVEDNQVKVQFSDYGNSETVPKGSVMKMDDKFLEPSSLALVASLGLMSLQDNALSTLLEWTNEKEVQVTLSFGTDEWLASLHLDGVDLSMKLINEKLATPHVAAPAEQETETEAEAPIEEPISLPSECTQVYISHIDTPGHFWLQMSDKIDSIEEIQAELQANAESYPDIENREMGTPCVAKYLADDQWYRAQILDADADITTVRFVDYGNTDVLDNKPGLIKTMPDNLKAIENYGVRASVNAVPTGTGEWSEPASEFFTQLVGDLSAPVDALVVLKDVTTYVDIFVGGQNLTDKLVTEGHAARSEEAECGDLPSCFASHINSPSEFWVQLESVAPELQAMEAAMVDAENFPQLKDKEEGIVCAAKYPEDEAWYRAQVIVDGSEGTEVLFMDYGNASITNELRSLPDDLKIKPALSRKCALQKPRDIKIWSRKSEVKFNELAAEGATIFNVQFIASGDISIVELFLEGKSVTEELVGLEEQTEANQTRGSEPVSLGEQANTCEQKTDEEIAVSEVKSSSEQAVSDEETPSSNQVALSERPTPVGQDLRSDGKICYVHSVNEFYINLYSAGSDIYKVTQAMNDADNFESATELKVGAICAAFWSADEHWYRARILEFCDAGYHVQFIDFGNKAKCDEFRKLPDELAVIEPLTKCCQLAGAPQDSTFLENGRNKLDNLALEDVLVQIEFLDTTKEPMLIRIIVESQDVLSLISSDKIDSTEEVVENESTLPEKTPAVQEVDQSITDTSNAALPEQKHEVVPTTEEYIAKETVKTEYETDSIVEKEIANDEELDACIDLNESLESNHTVIENKSFEANLDDLSADVYEDAVNESTASLEKDNTSSETLENSNDTIKTPEKEESKESIADTGYTSDDKDSPTKTHSESSVSVDITEKTAESSVIDTIETKPVEKATPNEDLESKTILEIQKMPVTEDLGTKATDSDLKETTAKDLNKTI